MKHNKFMALLLTLFALSANARAATIVDIKLSLVIDNSLSINAGEYALQMQGYAAAFRDAVVQNNILNGTVGKVAVNGVFFSGGVNASTLETFTILDSTAAINAFANVLEFFTRPTITSGTDIDAGMNHARTLLLDNSVAIASDLIMDVSGDGAAIISPTTARDAAAAAGITVNGLTIGAASLQSYYDANVITADGFTLHSNNFTEFEAAVVEKIRRETTSPPTTGEIPEPGTLAIWSIMGLGALVHYRRRRRTVA